MTQRFKVDLTLEINPEYIEDFFEDVAAYVEASNGTLTQYRYYVEKNDESQRNQS